MVTQISSTKHVCTHYSTNPTHSRTTLGGTTCGTMLSTLPRHGGNHVQITAWMWAQVKALLRRPIVPMPLTA